MLGGAAIRRSTANRPANAAGMMRVAEHEQDAGHAHRRRHHQRERDSGRITTSQKRMRCGDSAAASSGWKETSRSRLANEVVPPRRSPCREARCRATSCGVTMRIEPIEKLLDVLRALRCAVERQHPDRRRHRIRRSQSPPLVAAIFRRAAPAQTAAAPPIAKANAYRWPASLCTE